MADTVDCKCVLKIGREGADLLYLVAKPDFNLRILPCRPKGQTQREKRPEWEYEEKDGRLHVTPSLLATDTGFHTAFNWSCDYVACPDGVGGYDHFYSINPEHRK
jgi:hypothetical protein